MEIRHAWIYSSVKSLSWCWTAGQSKSFTGFKTYLCEILMCECVCLTAQQPIHLEKYRNRTNLEQRGKEPEIIGYSPYDLESLRGTELCRDQNINWSPQQCKCLLKVFWSEVKDTVGNASVLQVLLPQACNKTLGKQHHRSHSNMDS